MKPFFLAVMVGLVIVPAFGDNEVREYTCNKVTGAPPTIDGNYTDAEWAGAEWTGDFYAIRHSANEAQYQGQVAEGVMWRWKALWDDENLYVCFNADLKYINMNGWVWSGDMVAILEADDAGYAGWGIAQNLDFEVFVTPQWDDDLTGYVNEVGGNPPAYQLAYFPLLADIEGDIEYAPSNFGVRNTLDGPPFFHTGTMGAANIGAWTPIYDPAEAEAAGVLPFQLAAEPHLNEGVEADGTAIVGSPILEIAFPYSQFSFPALDAVEVIEDVDILLENLIMIPDANGKYVSPGDEFLFNIAGYTDGPTAEAGIGLVSWNDMGDGGFHNAPRGKLILAGGTGVGQWMLH